MAREFRTVQYRGRQSLPEANTQLPDLSRNLETTNQYEQGKLRNLQESLTLSNNLVNRNTERLDALALEQQRAAISQASARNQAALQQANIYGQQKLRNEKLADDWTNEIYRLQTVQQAEKNRLKAQLKSQELESLTQFGAQLVQFSETLWKQQAQEINRKNEELQAQGVIDALLTPNYEGLFRQDQIQNLTLAKNAELQLMADELERAGRPNEAANLRSANPFYLYGLQEGITINASGKFRQEIDRAVQLAHEQGILKFGDTNYDAKLQALIQDQSRRFIAANGLTGINPNVLTKYFANAFIEGQTGITKQYNSQNNKVVKEEQLSAALGNFNLAMPAISEDPAEAAKNLDFLEAAAGSNRTQARGEAFNAAASYAQATGDRKALDNLMLDPRMQEFQDEYLKFDRQFQEQAAREAEKAQKELAEGIWGGFLLQVNQDGFDVRNLNSVRAQYIEQVMGAGLPVAIQGELINKLQDFGMNDLSSAQNALDALRASTPLDALPQTLRDFANDQRNPPALRQQAAKEAEAYGKANEPEWLKAELLGIRARVRSLAPKDTKWNSQLYPNYTKTLDDMVQRRMAILDQRIKTWMAQPGVKNADTFREWIEGKNLDIVKRPIEVDANGNFLELPRREERTSASSVMPLGKIRFPDGREYTPFLGARDRLLSGAYGRINIANSVVMNPNEVISWANQYESGNGINPTLQSLAARIGVPPLQLLEDQAKKFKMQGGIKHPSNYQSTEHARRGIPGGTRVTPDFARTFAIQAGLSDRGATWLVTNMMDESKGDATAVHDEGTGLGLFGHRLSRREALIQFARARGKSPTDGLTQLQFAVNEIKTGYPGIWSVITSRNPTRNQLWQASKDWLRFNPRVYDQRQRSLFNALGN